MIREPSGVNTVALNGRRRLSICRPTALPAATIPPEWTTASKIHPCALAIRTDLTVSSWHRCHQRCVLCAVLCARSGQVEQTPRLQLNSSAADVNALGPSIHSFSGSSRQMILSSKKENPWKGPATQQTNRICMQRYAVDPGLD